MNDSRVIFVCIRAYKEPASMWMFYAISLPVTLGMVVWMLMYYASPRVLPHVRIIVAYAWFVNVSIVILVPVDVWTVRQLKVGSCA